MKISLLTLDAICPLVWQETENSDTRRSVTHAILTRAQPPLQCRRTSLIASFASSTGEKTITELSVFTPPNIEWIEEASKMFEQKLNYFCSQMTMWIRQRDWNKLKAKPIKPCWHSAKKKLSSKPCRSISNQLKRNCTGEWFCLEHESFMEFGSSMCTGIIIN